MAYACPVCTEPQVDAEHLANHIAFTAITGDDAHEEWLDETVGEWGHLGQAELADVVVEHADETDFPVDVAEDPAESDHTHDGHHAGDHSHHGQQPGVRGRGPRPESSATPVADDGEADVDHGFDEDASDVLAEARELTREMQRGEDGESDAEPSDSETQ